MYKKEGIYSKSIKVTRPRVKIPMILADAASHLGFLKYEVEDVRRLAADQLMETMIRVHRIDPDQRTNVGINGGLDVQGYVQGFLRFGDEGELYYDREETLGGEMEALIREVVTNPGGNPRYRISFIRCLLNCSFRNELAQLLEWVDPVKLNRTSAQLQEVLGAVRDNPPNDFRNLIREAINDQNWNYPAGNATKVVIPFTDIKTRMSKLNRICHLASSWTESITKYTDVPKFEDDTPSQFGNKSVLDDTQVARKPIPPGFFGMAPRKLMETYRK